MKNHVYQDKVAIITGSSRGIGKAIALELAAQGMSIILNGRDQDQLDHTTTMMRNLGHTVYPIVADIRYNNQCRSLINRTIIEFGRIDVVINNAAVSSRGSVEDSAPSNFEMLIDTNYIGSAYVSKYAIPHLKKTQGHLIFINSVGGFRGMPYNTAYTASKMAQGALADALSIELMESNVHVGIAYVGFTENDPKKMILDVDGAWVYLPKRNNIQLDTQTSVARSIFKMIKTRRRKLTLTLLGKVTNVLSRYFPRFTRWLIVISRNKIKDKFTFVTEPETIERTYKAKELINPEEI